MEMERIAARFALFAGLSAEEAQPWQGLWQSAAQALEQRLRPGVDTEANAERLACAAAAAACRQYRALTQGGASSLRIGDLAVNESPAAPEGAEEAFLAWIGDLLTPGPVFYRM